MPRHDPTATKALANIYRDELRHRRVPRRRYTGESERLADAKRFIESITKLVDANADTR
jgi:hypothetical protein